MCMCPFFPSTLLSFSLLRHEVIIKKRLANLRYARVVYVPRNKKRNIKSKREEREQQTTITEGEKEIEDKRKESLPSSRITSTITTSGTRIGWWTTSTIAAIRTRWRTAATATAVVSTTFSRTRRTFTRTRTTVATCTYRWSTLAHRSRTRTTTFRRSRCAIFILTFGSCFSRWWTILCFPTTMTTTLLAIWFYKQADMCYRHDLERLLTIVYLFQLLIDTRNANAWNRQVSTEKEEWELIAKSSSLSRTTSSPYQPIILFLSQRPCKTSHDQTISLLDYSFIVDCWCYTW